MLCRKYQAFGLIEVLIALFVLCIGLFGLMRYQRMGLEHSRHVLYHHQAIMVARSLIAELRQQNLGTDISAVVAPWQQVVARRLPHGELQVSGTPPSYALTVDWDESSGHQQLRLSFAT